MDPISIKYTGAPFPSRGPDRVCFVIAVEKAAQHTLDFVHRPGATSRHQAALAPSASRPLVHEYLKATRPYGRGLVGRAEV